jgi:membrane dipeptidase
MKEKVYDGYQPFEYLEAGVDFPEVELVEQLERVPSYTVEVTDSQEQRVQRLIEENLVISLHDHPDVGPKDPDRIVEHAREGRAFIGYEGLAQSGLDCVFDNMANGTAIITSRAGWKWTDIIHDLGMRVSDIDHQDFVIVARQLNDIDFARRSGRLAFVLTLESATPIENELERLEILYGLGVRSIGVTYSQSNALGNGLSEPRDGGLTRFGREAVKLMNKLGVLIDVSHTGDQTALDTIELSNRPIVISHAGARALWNTNRLMPDEVIQACAAKGGLIGIEAAPHTTLTEQHPHHSIESFMEHFEYCVDLVGIDHVTFGPDALFGDHVAAHHAFRSHLAIGEAHGTVDYEEVPYVKGLENPAETFPNIIRWLVKHNYSDGEIQKAIGENTMRVLREVWYR